MSLLSTAAPWNSNENTKKRVPTIRRTQKKNNLEEKPIIRIEEEIQEDITEENTNGNRPSTFEEDNVDQEERSERINKVLNNMSNVLQDNDGSKLATFQPISPPNVQKKTDDENAMYGRNGDQPIQPIPNHLQLQPPKIKQQNTNFGPNIQGLGNMNQPYQTNSYSNYRKIYTPSSLPPQIRNNIPAMSSTVDNKLIEKINYMIYMLEQQQNEKTSNITEEFILYLFLGVFIIFIVDSFTKNGKYVR
jgi:hypothetical protein